MLECLSILNCQGGVLDQLNNEIIQKYGNLERNEVMTKVSEENKGKYNIGDKFIINGVEKVISEIKLGNVKRDNGEPTQIEFFTLKVGRKKNSGMTTYYDLKRIQTKQMLLERGIALN
jgi:hypothetical protein